MPDKVTSADVAHRAGVSRSAVSRVFTPGASASPATVEKVKLAAKDLGYRPNTLARGLLTGRSRIIGVVVAYLENQFYPQALERLCHALKDQGYHVMVFMTTNAKQDVESVVQGILDHQVDGLVLASVSLTSEMTTQCHAQSVPVVMFNRRQADAGASVVVSNNHAGGRLAAEHLLARGAQRVGYIAGWEGASTQREREAGFLEGLRSCGKGLYAREVGDFTDIGARSATLAMFSGADRPDAIFVANDHMAVTVMDVLRFDLGLTVPGDVAVVGFDDVPAAAWRAYDLTTVRQDTDAMVAATVGTMMEMLDENAPRKVVETPVTLIKRSSA